MVIDLKSYLNRTGFSKADLCRKLGLDAKSSLLSSYEKGRSDPSYDMCVKLLQLGMTVEELFGVNYMPLDNSNEQNPIKITDADLSRAFLRAAEILGGKK